MLLHTNARRFARVATARVMLPLICCSWLGLQGCSWFKKKEVEPETRLVQAPADYTPTERPQVVVESDLRPSDSPPRRPRPTGLQDAGTRLHVIYFDYDQSEIRSDQLENVDLNLRYLLAHPEVNVLIEGHCDDRGTTEYNFSLGERRAQAIENYYTKNGVATGRIQVLSKGEEEPVEFGGAEAAWSMNRRCEFKFFD